jgi:hypothetical protein
MNKFNIRSGFLSRDFVSITGSLYITAGITGSANTASFANTASYSVTATTASFVTLVNSASYSFNSLSSSFADVAEYSPLTGTGSFEPPYVSGSLLFSSGSFLNPNVYSPFQQNNFAAASPVISQSLILAPLKVYKDCTVKDLTLIYNGTNPNATASVFIYANTNKMLPGNKLYQGSFSDRFTPLGFLGYLQFTPTSSIQLKNNNVYWIGMAVHDANSTYRQYNTPPINRVYNPLLGVAVPGVSINNYIQNITHYVLPNISNVVTGIPNTCSQNVGDYSFIANSTVLPVLPFIRIE